MIAWIGTKTVISAVMRYLSALPAAVLRAVICRDVHVLLWEKGRKGSVQWGEVDEYFVIQ